MFGIRNAVSAIALAIAIPAVAQAQATLPPGGRIVSIGDSLSDNGNLLGLTGNPPVPYFQGRFSNGPVWTELISKGPMNQPFLGGPVTGDVNLAFGGARTDNAVNLNGPIPSMQVQLATFLALGGTFSTADTVTLLGGANNIFQYFQAAGAGASPAGIQATSVSAATDIANLTQAVATGGAGRILVANLPDIGASPAYNTTVAGSGAGTAATVIFNQALGQSLQALAAANPNTNIVQMDLYAAFNVIRANAAAFGFTNVTQSCLAVITCVGGGTAAQNAFLFWDSVHPTAAGHRLLAMYAMLLLNPEGSAADAAVLGSAALRGRQTAADDVSDRAIGWSQGQYERRNGTWISATGSRAMLDARGDTAAHSITSGGVRAGLDRAFSPSLLAGVSVGANLGSIGGVVRADTLGFDVDAYATYTAGAFFVSGGLGASWTSFDDIRRNTGFGPVDATGSTSATQLSATLEAGMFAKVGSWTLAPSARLQLVHGHVDAYAETAPMLALAFNSRSFDAVIGGVKFRASTPAALFGRDGRAFGEVGYERVLSENQDGVLARFVGNTAQPFTGRPGELIGRGLNLKVGYDAKLSDTMALTLSYGAALNDGQGVSHSGQARIKMPF